MQYAHPWQLNFRCRQVVPTPWFILKCLVGSFLIQVLYSQFLTPNIIQHRFHVCTYPVTFLAITAAQYQYTIMLIPAQMEEEHVNRYQHLDQAAAMVFLLSVRQSTSISLLYWDLCIARITINFSCGPSRDSIWLVGECEVRMN